MTTATGTRAPRLSAVMREGERVMPLELFFDLVFVLAITQCTALMFNQPTWEGLAQGLLVLGVLWWSWTGYAWLTSVVDPEEGAVRIVIFAAMAAFLIVAICVPEAFDELALEFALAYGAVRAAHIALFVLASRGDAALRKSVDRAWRVSTAIGVGLLVGASSPRRPRAGRAVGPRAAARHGRAVLLRLRGLEARPRPLRRAARTDHHHRPGRIDRRDRRRRRRPI